MRVFFVATLILGLATANDAVDDGEVLDTAESTYTAVVQPLIPIQPYAPDYNPETELFRLKKAAEEVFDVKIDKKNINHINERILINIFFF